MFLGTGYSGINLAWHGVRGAAKPLDVRCEASDVAHQHVEAESPPCMFLASLCSSLQVNGRRDEYLWRSFIHLYMHDSDVFFSGPFRGTFFSFYSPRGRVPTPLDRDTLLAMIVVVKGPVTPYRLKDGKV